MWCGLHNKLFLGGRHENIPEIPEVTQETDIKFLGFTLGNQLTWNAHIDGLCKKLSSDLLSQKS